MFICLSEEEKNNRNIIVKNIHINWPTVLHSSKNNKYPKKLFIFNFISVKVLINLFIKHVACARIQQLH